VIDIYSVSLEVGNLLVKNFENRLTTFDYKLWRKNCVRVFGDSRGRNKWRLLCYYCFMLKTMKS